MSDGQASVTSLISEHYAQLSSSHRRIADFILAEPHQAAFMTLEDFARETGTSQATTNRLGQKLGLSGFQELKRLLRAGVQEALSPVDELVSTLQPQHLRRTTPWAESIDEDIERLKDIRAVGGEPSFAKACTLLASANRVFLIGFGSSAFIAQYAEFCLSNLRDNCESLVSAGGIEGAVRKMLGAGPADAALVIASARYSEEGIKLAERLHEAQTPLILISDSEKAPHAPYAEHHFVVERKSSFVMSGAGTGGIAVVEALLRGTASAIGAQEVERRSLRLTALLGEAIVPPRKR